MLILENTLHLFLEAAPWLLFGLVAAGLVKAWVPEEKLKSWLGGRGAGPAVRAALVGAPLPLCSCGVLPAAMGLRRAGASREATVSFMIATPETGVDSVSISYALLGPFMAVARPVAAVAGAIATGLMVALLPREETVAEVRSEPAPSACASGCCGSSSPVVIQEPSKPSILERTIGGLRYAMTDILGDVAIWLGVGLLLAGVMATFIPPQALAEWGSGLPAMLAMLAVGVPMYICATASTPLAAGLLAAGVSPGTVMVFLLAGPATNIATIAVTRKELGGAAAAIYLVGICASALAAGFAVDAIVAVMGLDIAGAAANVGHAMPRWVEIGSAAPLVAFALWPLARRAFTALGAPREQAS